MTIEIIKPQRSEVLKCVARYNELTPVTTGLPDMQLEQCKRTFLSVLGFEQPQGDEQHSPFGNHVSPKISTQRTGFGAAFVRSKPGRGVLMSDGYEPYEVVAKQHSLVHLGCWAHCRRYFNDALQALPKDRRGPDSLSARFIDLIGQLYPMRVRDFTRFGFTDILFPGISAVEDD